MSFSADICAAFGVLLPDSFCSSLFSSTQTRAPDSLSSLLTSRILGVNGDWRWKIRLQGFVKSIFCLIWLIFSSSQFVLFLAISLSSFVLRWHSYHISFLLCHLFFSSLSHLSLSSPSHLLRTKEAPPPLFSPPSPLSSSCSNSS